MAHEAGKGSAQRPSQISQKQFNDNWDQIFGKKDKKHLSTAELDKIQLQNNLSSRQSRPLEDLGYFKNEK